MLPEIPPDLFFLSIIKLNVYDQYLPIIKLTLINSIQSL